MFMITLRVESLHMADPVEALREYVRDVLDRKWAEPIRYNYVETENFILVRAAFDFVSELGPQVHEIHEAIYVTSTAPGLIPWIAKSIDHSKAIEREGNFLEVSITHTHDQRILYLDHMANFAIVPREEIRYVEFYANDAYYIPGNFPGYTQVFDSVSRTGSGNEKLYIRRFESISKKGVLRRIVDARSSAKEKFSSCDEYHNIYYVTTIDNELLAHYSEKVFA